jgi:methylated-DNA-[protein]-cysteine S-methyltransferase
MDRMETPIGELLLVTDGGGTLRAVDWMDYEARMLRLLKLHYRNIGYTLTPNAAPSDIRDKLKRYFAGDVHTIDDIAVETAGTAFQRSVWKELRNIPSGSPISYRTLAQQIDRPKAVRAVGLANGSNPIGIVVPCHRVVGANGSLTGYGGGLERKRWLLDHERRHASGR